MSHTGIELDPHPEASNLRPRRHTSDSQAPTWEVVLVLLLLAVLGAELVVVHALVAEALREGNTALEVWRELSGKPA